MKSNTCSSCGYYRQHYTFDRQKIFRVYCGHCTCKKAKARKPDSKTCENYVKSEPDKEAFATKEYLSKALLEYLLKLELLPEIDDSKE